MFIRFFHAPCLILEKDVKMNHNSFYDRNGGSNCQVVKKNAGNGIKKCSPVGGIILNSGARLLWAKIF